MTSPIEKRKAERAERAELEAFEDTIIAALPGDLSTVPTISNVRIQPRPLDESAFLSFSGPSYDPGKTYNPVAVLQSLERAGWTQCPACLCKWDDYRRAPEAGLLEAIPETKHGSFGHQDKLNDCTPIAPLWVVPCQYTSCDVQLYMLAPDGRRFKVLVDVPGLASIQASRTEYKGGWSFKRGSAKLRFPQAWYGHPHCTISEHARAWVDTEQGVSGAIYFMPHGEQAAWPLTASEFLASLMS